MWIQPSLVKKLISVRMIPSSFINPYKTNPVFHKGIIKTLMHFYKHCILYRVFFFYSNSRTILLAAGCVMNTEICQPFLMFLHFPSLCFLTYNVTIYSSFPFLLCWGVWVLFFIVVVFFFFLGLFFFLFILASRLNCYSVRMSIKIHFNLNGTSVRRDLWVRISWLQLSHMEAENRMTKL